ncbi:hypothetical protein PYCCODRAFT_1359298 [Trametes coccinea BRFM310]|uniref:CxC1-like cysteine cluster associated with KDZ transposases domain-containing protein n=1 Tax=Trametes coccinea (strain BRFM310) TaxID=1353009 RepID=A0A1Y2J2M6_TRAC3|nr:hypothetical protein PYCCODRAFT_1359298 [Trametes coccinea BRFM310]
MERHWAPVIPRLVDAYLIWRYPPAATSSEPVDVDPDYTFTINVIDIYSLTTSATITRTADCSAAEALVKHGYLGNTPINPSLAISLKTLELFRCLKLVKASFSAEAFAKLVCYQYYIPYRPLYRTAIADAFDTYLTIQRLILRRVMGSLGRDEPDWRARYGCPACSYVLEGEEPGYFARYVAMDGNSSLKRLATSGKRSVGDTRSFDSDYRLARAFVDGFAHEVKARRAQAGASVPRRGDPLDGDEGTGEVDDNDSGGPDDLAEDDGGDPTDGKPDAPTPCASHWKAAAADEKKRMWGIFEETGIFASACRHGLILWVADMVRSGEQAKYALAMVAKLHAALGGRLMIGYDIGCDFSETVNNSSLGPEVLALGTRFCVNAFHGYSHSYNCQVVFHPNVIVGMGLEDLEVLERIFSGSNHLAPVVRYASRYRRWVLIDQYFQQWDQEKYANIGLMLFNNLSQALDIVRTQSPVLEQALKSLQLTHADLDRFANEEREFFLNLRDEEDHNLHAVAYVEALQELRSASEELASASRRFNDKAPEAPQISWQAPRTGATDYDTDLSMTRKLETRRRYLRERVKQLTAEVTEMEVALNIEARWQPCDALYQQTLQYMATRKYQRALGKLQRLVILRLFELHKMNLAQTGYRMRTYIAKNLQRRCKAIRSAVKEYNAAAQALDPPRETLDWTRVSHYTFLEEFTLLRGSRDDLHNKPWSHAHIRETMRISRRIARAREEIENVNREARRLHTHIRDEECLLTRVLNDLKMQGDPLHGAVLEYARHRRTANARNLAYLMRMYSMEGFTGNSTPGTRAAVAVPIQTSTPASREDGEDLSTSREMSTLVAAENEVMASEEKDGDSAGDNDIVHEEVSGILEFLASLRT